MESTRPIRALTRGLDALTVLNLHEGATVSEVAQETRLPRTTVYRILETLCNAGFVFRDPADDRYRLTILVRALSGGFADEAWVSQIAKPLIHELSREIIWPVSVATLSGNTMLVRESTDHTSPLAIERYCAGFRAPLLTSAMGRVYLANSPGPQRATLIDGLARSDKEEDKPARARADLERNLADIKASGYAITARTQRMMEELSISVPVLLPARVLASLTVRFALSAVPLNSALERFLPKLRRCAGRIGILFSGQHAAASVTAEPETAA
ncbi:MAG TPA: helix-turn-helix domain-containing protein [Steroidobacteraceae bacterium]|jgi:IclR family mhp operon transcriptional activator|nr:helix-turn-helix domain-containing protein [Steroidobacteraceae bacterium]